MVFAKKLASVNAQMDMQVMRAMFSFGDVKRTATTTVLVLKGTMANISVNVIRNGPVHCVIKKFATQYVKMVACARTKHVYV
jgi:hypothetical protein|tara:strand:- start:49 stop:294 length:246 start_codon:yes stop_codon:yes gene_type:complete